MAVNKVSALGKTLIDLTGDTVTADALVEGFKAHDASGTEIEGELTDATSSKHGLMSAADKTKLDAMNQESDDMLSCSTQFTDSGITQNLGDGRVKTITFNADGSITEVVTKTDSTTVTLTTVFGSDGSITRTRS